MVTTSRTASQSGQSLVETVAALGVSVLVIGALVSLGVAALRSSGAAKNAAEAQTLVNEEMELIRAYRDRESFGALETAVSGCDGGGAVGVCGGVDNCHMDALPSLGVGSGVESPPVVRGGVTFTRCFNYDASDSVLGDRAHVVAIVTWEDSRGTHTTVAETYLAKWQ